MTRKPSCLISCSHCPLEGGNIPDDKAPSPGMGVRLGEVKNPPLTSGVLSDLIGQAWEKSLCFDAKL
jgi:hypothetical protein